MAMVQMNTRIDEDIKQVGDAAFAKVGYTPSRVVQLVWQLAAADDLFPRMLAQFAIPSNKSLEEQYKELMLEEVERGANLVAEFRKSRGLPDPEPEELDYKKMRNEWRDERWVERGLA